MKQCGFIAPNFLPKKSEVRYRSQRRTRREICEPACRVVAFLSEKRQGKFLVYLPPPT